ncbi:MAG: hypothetical protein KJ587_05900 [Alphaproteobacteria bacterium]|nr:hypothetical protein [Alphaproteobacteria bacterium]
MKVNMITTAIFAGAAAAVALVAFASTDAEARGSKEIYQKSYMLDKPLHGVEGHAGPNYYCTYKRFPVRKCNWNGSKEVCRIVKWELEQTCY